MYRDNDRRVLAAIEDQLRRHDPGFLERMNAAPAHRRRFPILLVPCAMMYIAAPLAMLLFGWPGVMVCGLLVGAVTVGVALHRRRAGRPSGSR